MWLDIEGGLTANTPAWDVTFLRDDGVQAIAFRYVTYHNKRQRSLVRRSVPSKVFADMRQHETHMLEYTEGKDKTWSLAMHGAVKNKVEACMQAVLLKQVPKQDLLVAWNMNAHDKRVLARICPSLAHRSWDPLPWFRKQVGLPRNGLGTSSAGSPRHALKVHDMFKHMGPSHTSLVDTLYMRACVQRAVALVLHGNMDFARVEELPEPSLEELWRCTDKTPHTYAATVAVCDAAFDSDGRILPECSKATKYAICNMLRAQLGVQQLPKHTQNAINGCRQKASLQRVILRTINEGMLSSTT
jgi:hypothetical protein